MVNGNWKVPQAEFNGFVRAKLEDMEKLMEKFIDSQTGLNTTTDTKIDKLERTQSRFKGYAAGLSLFGGVIGGFIKGLFGGGSGA